MRHNPLWSRPHARPVVRYAPHWRAANAAALANVLANTRAAAANAFNAVPHANTRGAK